jgi:hypothetical protein
VIPLFPWLNRAIVFVLMELFQFLAVWAVFLKAGNLSKILLQDNKMSFLFVPYQSPDCLALHKGIAQHIRWHNTIVRFYKHSLSFSLESYLKEDSSIYGLLGFQNWLRAQCKNHHINELYYPILDTTIRVIPLDYFTIGFSLKDEFFSEIKCYIKNIEARFSSVDACFLADSAYLNNHILKQLFIKSGRSVYYLNPNGKINKYLDIYHSEFSVKKIDSAEYRDNKIDVDNYIKLRFSGKINSDLDSSSAFAAGESKPLESKKVLFLHAFRDANNNTWESSQPFDSYYEWVDFTLSVLNSRNDFSNWYIKRHPSSKYYENDEAILDELLVKYDVPRSCLGHVPTTSQILSNPMPIYTNNGTIVLESASVGIPAFFCGPRFSAELGIYASTKEQWSSMLIEGCLIENKLDEKIIDAAISSSAFL